MQKKTIDKKEFQKAVKWCSTIAVAILLVFTTTSWITGNWRFFLIALWSVFLVTFLTLTPFYAAYKKEQKAT